MTITVKAIYEHGILRPIEPISLVEGTRVEVTVIVPASEPVEKTPAEIPAAIAAMPIEGSEEKFSAQDHDRVLYTQP